MSLDVGELASQMFEAFKEKLSNKWPVVKDYAEVESKKLAENFVMIEKLKLTGEITEAQAKLHHEIQRNASSTVLLTLEGLELVAVEEAVNAAMEVLKETVNGALDFALL
jgi:lipopolysaccharide biosynthesis regulator YciM